MRTMKRCAIYFIDSRTYVKCQKHHMHSIPIRNVLRSLKKEITRIKFMFKQYGSEREEDADDENKENLPIPSSCTPNVCACSTLHRPCIFTMMICHFIDAGAFTAISILSRCFISAFAILVFTKQFHANSHILQNYCDGTQHTHTPYFTFIK